MTLKVNLIFLFRRHCKICKITEITPYFLEALILIVLASVFPRIQCIWNNINILLRVVVFWQMFTLLLVII